LLSRCWFLKKTDKLRTRLWLRRMPSSGMWHRVALVRTDIPLQLQFPQQPHGVTSQKTAFFIATAMKTSDLMKIMTDFTKLAQISTKVFNTPPFTRMTWTKLFSFYNTINQRRLRLFYFNTLR
jgi:hypothetical protein